MIGFRGLEDGVKVVGKKNFDSSNVERDAVMKSSSKPNEQYHSIAHEIVSNSCDSR